MPRSPIPAADYRLFAEGHCAVLAAALHERTGWPLVVESDPLPGRLDPTRVRHVWVLNPAHRAVDIGGVHPWGVGEVCNPNDLGQTQQVSLTHLRRLQAEAFACAKAGRRAQALLNHHQNFFGLRPG